MLESLTLENFQKHQNLHIDFDPHITCVVGASDQGKSSIIRALYWVMTNQIRGDSFIHHGSDYVKGTLRIDGHEIVREKGRSRNLYRLDGGRPFEAFGAGIPDEIAALVNVCRSNFQLQLDSPYLLSLSPGEVSRELNSIVNLDLIDSILSYLASEQRKAKTTVQVCEERLQQARDKKKELLWVTEADRLLRELEDADKEILEVREKLAGLTELLDGLDGLDETIQRTEATIIAIEEVIKTGQAWQEAKEQSTVLASLVQELTLTDKKLEAVAQQVDEQEKTLRTRLDGKCPLCASEVDIPL